jgi:hypothetical protein
VQRIERVFSLRLKDSDIDVDAEPYSSRSSDESLANVPPFQLGTKHWRFAKLFRQEIKKCLSILSASPDLQPLLLGNDLPVDP